MARILVADDEKSIRNTLSEFAKEDGYEVFTAQDTEERFRVLQEISIDVVVTDTILSHVAGVALLGRMQEARPDGQVIIITAAPTVDTAAVVTSACLRLFREGRSAVDDAASRSTQRHPGCRVRSPRSPKWRPSRCLRRR